MAFEPAPEQRKRGPRFSASVQHTSLRVDAHPEPIRFQTLADGFERMAVIERRFNLGPKASELAGLAVRLFLAESCEAASGSRR